MTDDIKRHVDEVVQVCRREVDRDLHILREQVKTHTLTEEQAEEIATRAAHKAKDLTKQELIADVKNEIADGAISILKNAIKIISVVIVGLGFYLSGVKLPWK